MREYRYRVDREGRIPHDGTEIVDPATLGFFLQAILLVGAVLFVERTLP